MSNHDDTFLDYKIDAKQIDLVIRRETRADFVGCSAWRSITVSEKYFADGEPNFTVPNLHRITSHRVLFVADWSCPKQRYLDMVCLLPIAEMKPQLLTVLIPFFPTATMEREVEHGSIATANVDAKWLSGLPCPLRILAVDLHTLQNQFYFYNCCVSMLSCMPIMISYLLEKSKKPVVVFPDDGAHKRFKSIFERAEFETVYCAKQRKGDERFVQLAENGSDTVAGRPTIIVDDLVRTGGTLLQCRKALKEAGATEVDIFVTHAAFPGKEYEKFLDKEAFDGTFFTTNSITKSVPNFVDMPEFYIFALDSIVLWW